MVDCTALEMRHTGDCIQGSNPCLSAVLRRSALLLTSFFLCVYSYGLPKWIGGNKKSDTFSAVLMRSVIADLLFRGCLCYRTNLLNP